MVSTRWQKQHLNFRRVVWGISAVISILLILLLLLLGFRVEVAGIWFLIVFMFFRVSLAFIFKNRYANSMVRILKFDLEEIERDLRMVFKEKGIRFHRDAEEETYTYEFPGRHLSMTAQPYWLSIDMNAKPVTKLTLLVLNAKNKEFAEMLAGAIDEMAENRTNV